MITLRVQEKFEWNSSTKQWEGKIYLIQGKRVKGVKYFENDTLNNLLFAMNDQIKSLKQTGKDLGIEIQVVETT